MTASRNKASRAVTAALVGVLSVGAVPMVAVAAEATDGGASLLVSTAADHVASATVTGVTDKYGNYMDLSDDEVITFSYNGESQYLIPTQITGDELGGTVYLSDEEYVVKYFKACKEGEYGSYKLADGQSVKWVSYDGDAIKEAGTYYAVVTLNKETSAEGSSCFVRFVIADTSWDDAYVCDYTNKDITDTTIEYSGKDQTFGNGELGLVHDGKYVDITGGPYDRKVYKKGAVSDSDNTNAKEAGDYVLRITVSGTYVYVPFTIVPLDISTSSVVLGDSSGNEVEQYATVETELPTQVLSIGDANVEEGKIDTATINLTCDVTAPDASKAGTYTYTVSATDPAGNVINSQELTVVRYENEATFTYNRDTIGSDRDYDLGTASFDPSAVQAVGHLGAKLDVSITYTDEYGNPLGDEQPTAPGTYYAVVSTLSDDYSYGGQVKVKFRINATLVQVDEIDGYYKGVIIDGSKGVEDIYDGTDLTQNLTVSATDEDGNAVPSDEIELVITDSDGNVVDEAVEAGTYTVTIKTVDGSSYLINDDDFTGTDAITLTIDPVTAKGDDYSDATANAKLRLVGTMGYGDEGDVTYVYTGDAVTPTFEYDLTASMWGYDSAEDWVTLPESTYSVRYQKATGFKTDDETGVVTVTTWEDVDECVEPGTYRAVLSDAESDSYVVNTTVTFKISDQKVYADVTNDQWYSSYVYDATDKGYMSGYADGTFFGPTDSISRADAVVVLWNMAGKPDGTPSEGSTSDLVTYDLPYTDVDEGAYYAQALQWATKVGIVAGDGDAQETFRPSASVTREELAKMLYVYEDLQGNVGDVDVDATLAAYEDEATVSAWARTYVAYLVDEGVMGVNSGLKGGDDITRAEVAAMVVRVQPGGQLDGFLTSK